MIRDGEYMLRYDYVQRYEYVWIYDYVLRHGCLNRTEFKNKVRGAFNKFPDFFEEAFKILVDFLKFNMLLLYILWDDWPIFMISGLNEQLQQQLEYTLIVTAGEFQKFNLDVRTL